MHRFAHWKNSACTRLPYTLVSRCKQHQTWSDATQMPLTGGTIMHSLAHIQPLKSQPVRSTHRWCDHAQLGPHEVLQRGEHLRGLHARQRARQPLHDASLPAEQPAQQHQVREAQLGLQGGLVAQQLLALPGQQQGRVVGERPAVSVPLFQDGGQALAAQLFEQAVVDGGGRGRRQRGLSLAVAEAEVDLENNTSPVVQTGPLLCADLCGLASTRQHLLTCFSSLACCPGFCCWRWVTARGWEPLQQCDSRTLVMEERYTRHTIGTATSSSWKQINIS